jgi:hypothetical protein
MASSVSEDSVLKDASAQGMDEFFGAVTSAIASLDCADSNRHDILVQL